MSDERAILEEIGAMAPARAAKSGARYASALQLKAMTVEQLKAYAASLKTERGKIEAMSGAADPRAPRNGFLSANTKAWNLVRTEVQRRMA